MRAARPEYERLYEAENVGISNSDADEIERASWTTTARLVEDFEEYVEEEAALTVESAQPLADTYGLDSARVAFVRAALGEDYAEMKKIADGIGEIVDAVADEINEAFSDGFGDVILDPTDEGYTVIEDYREDIEEWLLKLQK